MPEQEKAPCLLIIVCGAHTRSSLTVTIQAILGVHSLPLSSESWAEKSLIVLQQTVNITHGTLH